MTFFKRLWSKSNLYGRLCVVQLMLFVTFLLSSESQFMIGDPVAGPKYGGFIASIINMAYFFYTIQLLIILGYRGLFIRLLWWYFVGGIVVSLTIANPFLDILPPDQKPNVFSFFHIMNIGLIVFFCYAILKDIFSSRSTHSDHIWGAIAVYFAIIMFFAEFFEVITLQNPGLLGAIYEPGFPNYVQCMTFSITAISGTESTYQEAHNIMKKLGTFENMIGNLFLVVILGRLLSHPLKKLKKKKSKMISDILNSVLQVLFFSLIPFIVYLFNRKKESGFFNYIGLKKSPLKANVFALLLSILFLLPTILLLFISDEFRDILFEPETMTGKFREMGFSINTLILIFFASIIKTGLSEELFFRGFVAKRLISWLGFKWGNLLQAFIFGLVHILIFLAITQNVWFYVFMFFFSGAGAWLSAYLNEKLADGSIICDGSRMALETLPLIQSLDLLSEMVITSKKIARHEMEQCIIAYKAEGVEAFIQELHDRLLFKKVKFPVLEDCAIHLYQQIPKGIHIDILDRISHKNTEGGNVILGKVLQLRLKDNIEETITRTIQYIINGAAWYVSDIIGERVWGEGLRTMYPEMRGCMETVKDHENEWMVRSIGAGIHYATKKGLSIGECRLLLKILLSLARDRRKPVQTGIGWAAKTTAKYHPALIEEFHSSIYDNEMTHSWFRRKVEIGLKRQAYAKTN